jgi:hypothetical protein
VAPVLATRPGQRRSVVDRHNGRPWQATDPERTMWVIYLNVALAVVIVAVFVIWTLRGRK